MSFNFWKALCSELKYKRDGTNYIFNTFCHTFGLSMGQGYGWSCPIMLDLSRCQFWRFGKSAWSCLRQVYHVMSLEVWSDGRTDYSPGIEPGTVSSLGPCSGTVLGILAVYWVNHQRLFLSRNSRSWMLY